jgi:hypothetical protein
VCRISTGSARVNPDRVIRQADRQLKQEQSYELEEAMMMDKMKDDEVKRVEADRQMSETMEVRAA